MTCYSEKEYRFCERGWLEDCIDGAYLLTMVHSARDWHREYAKTPPFSTLHVQYNPGYKNCTKDHLYKQNSESDLVDALGNVFRTALRRQQHTILVLEDDFFFDWTEDDARSIKDFICNHPMDIYHLGALPVTGFPAHREHIRVIDMGLSQGVIYCEPGYMRDYLAAMERRTTHMSTDRFWAAPRYLKYHYYKPVCFQLFPETENSKHWHTTAVKWLIRKFELEHHHGGFKQLFSIYYIGMRMLIVAIVVVSLIKLCIAIIQRHRRDRLFFLKKKTTS